jgi:hypothetical protein
MFELDQNFSLRGIALISLLSAAFFGGLCWLETRDLIGLPIGATTGFVAGCAYYVRKHNRRGVKPRLRDAPIDLRDPALRESYPADLRRLELRFLTFALLLRPALVLVSFLVSLFAFGNGLYGVPFGCLAAIVLPPVLARLLGPNDPHWRNVREAWKREHFIDSEKPPLAS